MKNLHSKKVRRITKSRNKNEHKSQEWTRRKNENKFSKTSC
jgi:hypothetical protein